ncbi:MAG: tetratricopeptide repeat protein, partial [Opitutaceae bacterium]
MKRGALASLIIAVATVAAYYNSFAGPFVFDDLLSIRDNPTLAPFGWGALVPPSGAGVTVEGRPLLNFSFALNRAASGQSVWSYHAVNLAIHVVAALALFGVVRRTLLLPAFAERWRRVAGAVGMATALLWAVHPVQTESVTYIVQRAESLMGMWFLLACYGFVRASGDGCNPRWHALTIAACYAAALSKEVSAAIPVLILIYDRTFLSGAFKAAWRMRGGIHAALFASWIVIGVLVATSGSRGGTVGFGSNVAWTDYALTQIDALALYMRLAFWPAPLIFDYGVAWVQPSWSRLLDALLVIGVVAGTSIALFRWPKWGFLGLWFLAMLAPTSLIPGNRQTVSEHRIYLSLAAPLLGGVVALFHLCGGRGSRRLVATLAIASAVLVARRNADYRSDLVLYADTVAKRPGNGFAHYNLGKALAESGEPARAITAYQEAVRLEPGLAAAHYNLGNALAALGRHEEALVAFERALAVNPRHSLSHYNLGNSFVALGRRAAT